MWLSRIVDMDLYLLEKMHKVFMLCKCAAGSNMIIIGETPTSYQVLQSPEGPGICPPFWPYLLTALPSLEHYTLMYVSNC